MILSRHIDPKGSGNYYHSSDMIKFGLATTIIVIGVISLLHNYRFHQDELAPSKAPKPTKFVSEFLQNLKSTLVNFTSNANLKKLISNCMLNTLDTTVIYNASEAFIITGDINAMWLRDSTNQLHPFVQFVKNDTKIDWLVQKIIARQASMIRADPYANAFNYEIQSSTDHVSDNSKRLLFGGIPFNAIFQKAIVFERKYEIDSLAAFLRLSNEYFKWSQSTSFVDIKWIEAYERILKVIQVQRLSFEQEDDNGDPPYTFSRTTSQPTDSLSHSRGTPVGKCGLIRSTFRPSDDSTTFQYFIPGNAMMQTELNKSLGLLSKVSLPGYDSRVKALISAITPLQQELKDAIYKYGVVKDSKNRDIFAYEVDCYGNAIKMDDANSPSLLGLPYLEFVNVNDEIYKNTREYVWSASNPYFFKGAKGEGIGGPHAGQNYIWPMSIIMKGLTSTNKTEIEECLRAVSNTTANTFFMHESFNKNNDYDYTRSWFAWANTMFGHFVLNIYRQYPDILKNFS